MDEIKEPDPTAGEPCPKHRARGVNVLCPDCDHAASTGTSEDVEALARVIPAETWEESREIARAVLDSDWLAAREAAVFAAGEAAGHYDRACGPPYAPLPPYAPGYDEWRKAQKG